MFKFFEQLLDFIQHIEPKSDLHIFCNISRLARFEPKKLKHRVKAIKRRNKCTAKIENQSLQSTFQGETL